MTTTRLNQPSTVAAPEDGSRVTQLLNSAKNGDADAANELLELVYSQLRRIASNRMAGERADHSLQATELVHEAYLKLAGQLSEQDWESRGHFYGAAANAMRRILVDHARKRNAGKRGGGLAPDMHGVIDFAENGSPDHILAVDEAIQQLEKSDPRLGKLVQLRFYAGLSVEETAKVLGISRRTVMRDWTFARAFLYDAVK